MSIFKNIIKFICLAAVFVCINGVAYAKNYPPAVGTITPASGTSKPNQQVIFTTTYTDSNGWSNIAQGYFLVSASTAAANSCYAFYNQNNNKLYLRNNANTAWLGGYAPGSGKVIENSYARLDCSKTTVAGSGSLLTLNWALTFKEAFTGIKNTYLFVKDDYGLSQRLTLKGAWIIEPYLNYWILVDEHDKPLPTDGYYYNYTGGDRGLLNAGDIEYSWDNSSGYKAKAVHNSGLWTWAGMWYSLIRDIHDNTAVDFKNIFGPHVKSEYQGEINAVEVVVKSANSPSNNKKLTLKIELKDEIERVIGYTLFQNVKAATYTWVLPEEYKKKVKVILWVMDYAQVGDSITIDRIRLKARIPELTLVPSKEQAFLWTYSWLMNNCDPASGMVQDRSNFEFGEFENITATAKVAKIIYYAYRKGYTTKEDATAVITKIADTLINRVPRGPIGINTLWPHFTKDGGTIALPPHDGFSGTEWASGDTAYAALDIISALQQIGDPQNQIGALENFVNQINWQDLLSSDNFIGHGYLYEGTKIPYFWRGFGMETIGVNWAYASATGVQAEMDPPPSDNGSGFIDNILYPIIFTGVDRWGNDWDVYRNNMSDTQIGWYNVSGRNAKLANTGLFGLSAAETPEADGYQAYGVGGKTVPVNDGNSGVVTLHYSAMASDIRLNQAVKMWEVLRDGTAAFLQNKNVISPLNDMESMRVDKNTGKYTVNYLKGSWNLALQAEGWAMADPAIKNELFTAVQANAFLKKGYDLLKTNIPARALRVPLDYPTIQSAINAANNRDTVEVAPGQYLENIDIRGKIGIIIKGTIQNPSDPLNAAQNTIVNANAGLGFYVYNSRKIILDGLVITGANRDYYSSFGGAVSLISGEDNQINNCIIIKNTAGTGAGVYIDKSKRAKLSGNTFTQNNGHYCGALYITSIAANDQVIVTDNIITGNLAWEGGAGIRVNSAQVLISRNLVSNNTSDWSAGIYLISASGDVKNNLVINNTADYQDGAGITCVDSAVAIVNNVIHRNYCTGWPVYASSGIYVYGAVIPTIKNNIITQNNHGGICYIGNQTASFDYNDVYGNYPVDYTGFAAAGTGAFSQWPSFVEVDNDNNPFNNYQLLNGSPCINAGDPDQAYSDKDGSRNDMGIYGGPDSF